MIKFMQFYVTDGTTKAKVFYTRDNRTDRRECITLYAQDYSRALGKIFANYQNDTDIQSDYFDKGKVVIFADNPLYAAALARHKQNSRKYDQKMAAKYPQRAAA